MVFLIQNTQERDSQAIQAKLDELIRAISADPGFIRIERLTDQEIDEFRRKRELNSSQQAGSVADDATNAESRRYE